MTWPMIVALHYTVCAAFCDPPGDAPRELPCPFLARAPSCYAATRVVTSHTCAHRWQEGAPAAVAAAAGSRAADVFMGVDVFGRGSYGGGQVRRL